jgi:hypothetical protein
MISSAIGLRPAYARALRREIVARNHRLVKQHGLLSVCSYGTDEVVVYSATEDGVSHGNFFAPSYAAILAAPEWRERLAKAHTGRKHLPRHESGRWGELDSCTSSDALLMNIFCHPQTLAEGKLHRLIGVDPRAKPEFGVRATAPLKSGHRDRTEVDMRLGDLLVEAKLTEDDFQSCRPTLVERYADFDEVFEASRLPMHDRGYISYQLLRSVLAANATKERFCVIADARRPDLREQWFSVMQCIRNYEVRMRCQMLSWQEIAATLPEALQNWLSEKFGIFAQGRERMIDAAEWYW